MPYSCCTTTMSLAFSSSEVAATDVAEPLTSSPITRASEDDDPSATRTTLTSEPFARNPSDKAALNVASPHGVGGYVLRMPKLAEPEGPCPTRAAFDVSRVDRALKVIPTDGCHRRVRRELLLCEISGGRLTSFQTGWIPNLIDTTRDERLPARSRSRSARRSKRTASDSNSDQHDARLLRLSRRHRSEARATRSAGRDVCRCRGRHRSSRERPNGFGISAPNGFRARRPR
jgi:hypothetical protein